MRRAAWPIVFASMFACGKAPERAPLIGTSPLVAIMHQAARDFDVPAELLAGVAWSETALIDHARSPGTHTLGIMGLAAEGERRSIARAAELTGETKEVIAFDTRANVRGAAAILRAIADETYGSGALAASSSRDRWLEVVARYFDAGASGEKLALEVRKTIARGLSTFDDRGLTFRIPSFAELYSGSGIDGSWIEKRSYAVSGEYPSSTWVAANSGNYSDASRTAADIDVVVIHTTQGSYSGTISWIQNPASEVSAHYVVRASDGDITQMVRHEDIAWHAGNWSYNERSIGIEHEGWVEDPSSYTMVQYRASADLTRWLCDHLGVPKDRNHIIGHVEVPTATHTDPGQYWDWGLYMDLVNETEMMPTGDGVYRGCVYDSRSSDFSVRLGGARVTLSNGDTLITNERGEFIFDVPPGDYRATAEFGGWTTNFTERTVTAGMTIWGSIGMVPEMIVDQPPKQPVAESPREGATAIGGTPIFTASGVEDPEGDPLVLEVEIGADAMFARTVSKVRVQVPAGSSVVSWEHPATDLPAGVDLYWRTKARDPSAESPWSEVALFRVYDELGMYAPSDEVHDADALPGVGINAAPGAPQIVEPAEAAIVRTAHPEIAIAAAIDPDEEPLAYQVEIAAEVSFQDLAQQSRLLPSQGEVTRWVVPQPLVLGGSYYLRARAADARVFGPWSAPVAFSVDAVIDEEPPPAIEVEVLDDSGCTAAGKPGAGALLLLAGVFVEMIRRRR